MDKIVFFNRIAFARKIDIAAILGLSVLAFTLVFMPFSVAAESKVMKHLQKPHPATVTGEGMIHADVHAGEKMSHADAHHSSPSMKKVKGAEKMPAEKMPAEKMPHTKAMKSGQMAKEMTGEVIKVEANVAHSHDDGHAHDETDVAFQEAESEGEGEGAGHVGHKSATEAIVQNELEEVGIKEKVGTYVNGNLKFTDHTGRQVALGEFFDGKPVVLSFMYYTCPSICQYVIDAQKQAMSKMGMEIGKDFRAVTISFDKNDNSELGSAIYERYSSGFPSQAGVAVDWSFLTGNQSAIDQITSQLGFQFKWVEQSGEFAHTAAIYVISPDKKISRYFYGLNFSPFDLKLALAEAKEEKVRSTMERVLLYCYRYDEHERGFVADAWKIMRIGGAFTAGSIAVFLILMIRMERGRRDEVVAFEGQEGQKKT